MVDIAAISVVSSGLVALGTIATNFIGAERQRSHEADLDFERRAWERKSDALFKLIEQSMKLVDLEDLNADGKRERYALWLSKVLDELHLVRATVEALSSSRCRDELSNLLTLMEGMGIVAGAGKSERYYQDKWIKTDFDAVRLRTFLREQQQKAAADAVADFTPDFNALRRQALLVIEASRDSVRKPAD